MKSNTFLALFVSLVLVIPSAHAAKLKSNQKRLLQEKKSKQCFYVESVRKSNKFGWVNETKAKEIAKVKRKRILTASSEVNVRKVYVPKDWCQGS